MLELHSVNSEGAVAGRKSGDETHAWAWFRFLAGTQQTCRQELFQKVVGTVKENRIGSENGRCSGQRDDIRAET